VELKQSLALRLKNRFDFITLSFGAVWHLAIIPFFTLTFTFKLITTSVRGPMAVNEAVEQ